jgi:hypothetical protein
MRPGCECCNRELPADSADAWICSFECTFCTSCVQGKLGGRCPNCGGGFSPRPTRVGEALQRHPASTQRVHNPAGCDDAAR